MDDVEILGKEAWDYIAQLWCYIASAIDELRTKEEAGTYLPDQPIRLDFRRNGTDIALSSTINDYERTVTVPADELLMAIKHSGAAFFRKIQELSPSSSSSFDRYLSSLLS